MSIILPLVKRLMNNKWTYHMQTVIRRAGIIVIGRGTHSLYWEPDGCLGYWYVHFSLSWEVYLSQGRPYDKRTRKRCGKLKWMRPTPYESVHAYHIHEERFQDPDCPIIGAEKRLDHLSMRPLCTSLSVEIRVSALRWACLCEYLQTGSRYITRWY